jgi:hypothetical protein
LLVEQEELVMQEIWMVQVQEEQVVIENHQEQLQVVIQH